MQSPNMSPTFVVVRNTFVELVDEQNKVTEDEPAVPAFRRRRGSSFFRCSSEPLVAGGRMPQNCGEHFDVLSTEDEGSDGVMSTPEASPASSRAASPEPTSRRHLGDVAFLPIPKNHHLPQMITAPVFNSNFHQSVAQMPTAYAPFQVHPGQMPIMLNPLQCADARNTSAMLVCSASANATIPSLTPSPRGPQDGQSSCSSDAGTVSSIRANDSRSACHLIWCDHRAFKESSSTLKEQLEEESGLQVKTHKTAENCIRLFRKKQRAQGRPPCVILASWANAPALLAYLDEAEHVWAKVVVLCDARSCRRTESADQIMGQYPHIYKVATTWQDAVDAVSHAVGSFL